MTFHPDHFYVTLPSNSSEEYYGRQTPGHYYTRLATPLHVDPEEYEVGLAEISMPNTRYNVPEFHVTYTDMTGAPPRAYRISMKAGHYKSIRHLITRLNRSIGKTMHISAELPQNKFAHNRVSGRVTCYAASGFQVEFEDSLGILLGFGNSKTTKLAYERTGDIYKERSVTGMFEANVNRLSETLMIYSDIISPQFVGDHLVPMLRHLPHVPERRGDSDVVQARFMHVHYVGLQRAVIESIEIYYADSTGNEPTFQSGASVVKLHFRRKR